MKSPYFGISSGCSAFAAETIGTKVMDALSFVCALREAMANYDTSNDRVPGQHFVMVPEAARYVSAGVGRRGAYGTAQYVVREHRGRMEAFLRRGFAATVTGVAVVVYTIEAYKNDPEVTSEEIAKLAKYGEVTHVIVAVLGFAGPKAPLTPYRFVSNLAGGNNEALTYSADEIRAMAKEIKAYDDEWCVVAD